MPPKRKQSKTNWRKRGQEFEEAALAARQSRDLDVRTGGSFRGKADADLFSVTTGGSSAATAPRARSREERATTPLYVDRNVAANPHVPIVSKERTLGSKEKLTRHSMKVRKVQERAARQNAHTRPKPSAAAQMRALLAVGGVRALFSGFGWRFGRNVLTVLVLDRSRQLLAPAIFGVECD